MKAFSSQLRENSDYDSLWEICQRYGDALIDNSNALMMLNIRPESELKIPKITIKRALSALILIEGNKDAVSALIGVYFLLVDFVEDEVYNNLKPHLKTIKESEEKSQDEQALYVSEALGDETFAKRFKRENELKRERRNNLIKALNYLLQLAEREDLMVNEELIKNKEQGQ